MDEFFNILNSAHKSINFTIEKENNDELALFDVQIKRKKKLLQRKKTFTGCYFNFQSNCSSKRKVNLIRTLCHVHTKFVPQSC